jgi:tetratricopeptide (TPR) repeat protein
MQTASTPPKAKSQCNKQTSKSAVAIRKRGSKTGKSGRELLAQSPANAEKSTANSLRAVPVYEIREARAIEAHEAEAELVDAARSQWLTCDWDALASWHLMEFASHPKRVRIALLVASALHEVGDYNNSKEALKQAVEWGAQRRDLANIVLGQAHAALGRALLATKELDRAEKHFKACITCIAPTRSSSRYAKDRVFKEAVALGFLADACHLLQRGVSDKEAEPSSETAHLKTKIAFLSRHLTPSYQDNNPTISTAKARIALADEPGNCPNALARLPAYKLASRPTFFSLWRGPHLSALEWLCLKSFVDHGYQITLYTYSEGLDVPAGVEVADASYICDENKLDEFHYKGSPNGSRFAAGSDYFRYLGVQKTQRCWVDTDVICLSEHIKGSNSLMIAKESDNYYNISILGAGLEERAFIAKLVAECERQANSGPMEWGALGPKLVTRLISEEFQGVSAKAHERSQFYPLHWTQAGWVLLPDRASVVQNESANSWFIHLWNEVLTRSGYYKDLLPPNGSYLRDLIRKHDLESIFVGQPSEETLKCFVANLG